MEFTPDFRLKYASELLELGLPSNKYVVFGSGPLAERGIRENADIDLLIAKDLWEELSEKYEVVDGCMQLSEHINAYGKMSYVGEIEALIENANIFTGIRFARLQDILAWKTKKRPRKRHKRC